LVEIKTINNRQWCCEYPCAVHAVTLALP